MPAETDLKYSGGFFAKKTLRQLAVTLGDYRYTLEDAGSGPLKASKTRIVRSIALKTIEVPVEEWVAELGENLEERAGASAQARAALAKLIG